MEKVKKILIISSDKNLRDVLNFCFDGWGYEVFLEDTLSRDITHIKKISPDIIVIDVHSAHKSQLEICRLLKDDFLTASIPVIILINKSQLKSQLLNLKRGVDDYLIKPPDPLDLRIRVEMAIRRSQYNFYACPSTGLPGGRIVEEVIKDRIIGGKPFSFGYLDIDNFKFFNDVYSYIKGDRVIMQTAYMLYTIIKKFGNNDDFIGHIGGDDFVFVTTPERYKEICHNFILMFDKIIPFHYNREDRAQGFIMAKDRTRKLNKISLMSISVAIVNKDAAAEYKSILEINERVAEVKKYLKNLSGSKFMADRRAGRKGDSSEPNIYKREDFLKIGYKPIGQILLDKNLVSEEQLDEALSTHWKKGIIFGEILKELGFIKEEELTGMLDFQRSIISNADMQNPEVFPSNTKK